MLPGRMILNLLSSQEGEHLGGDFLLVPNQQVATAGKADEAASGMCAAV